MLLQVPSRRRLYFSTFSRMLYSVAVSALRDSVDQGSSDDPVIELSEDAVQREGRRRRGGADAMTSDNLGHLYFGLLPEG